MAPSSSSRYQDIPETKADLDWADLVTLDLSKFDRPGGKQELAAELKEAIHRIGFFYLINFGLSEDEVNRQFELGQKIFKIPEAEKKEYERNLDLPGGPLGFQLRGKGPGQRENMELYDDPKWNDIFKDRGRPTPCVENAEQSARFCRHLHYHVLYRLLVLAAIILQLDDEEELWKKQHDFNKMSNCHMRYMLQHPPMPKPALGGKRPPEPERLRGHTDFGTFTLLFRQPIAGLQVRSPNEKSWKWVRPYPGSITVNVADTLSALTGGYLKSSIHRVIEPPADQQGIPRLGVIYFTRPDDDTLLTAVKSPVINEAGNKAPFPPDINLTVAEWVKARHKGFREDVSGKSGSQIVSGVPVPLYV